MIPFRGASPFKFFSTISHTVVSRENFLVVASEMDIYIFLLKITTSATLSSRHEDDYYNELMIKNITKVKKAVNHSTPFQKQKKNNNMAHNLIFYITAQESSKFFMPLNIRADYFSHLLFIYLSYIFARLKT